MSYRLRRKQRYRQGFIKARTAQANQIRGLLAEYGLVVPQGINYIRQRVPAMLEDATYDLPGIFRALIDRLLDYLKILDQQIDEIEAQIQTWHRANEASQRLEQIPGIGPLTATAMVATVGNARNFKNGRELAAWLGLVPRQHSTGGKPKLLGISKRGDIYLRTLLIHGARSLAYACSKKASQEHWLYKLINRRGTNVAVVAQANKTARIVWAMLTNDRDFRVDYGKTKAIA